MLCDNCGMPVVIRYSRYVHDLGGYYTVRCSGHKTVAKYVPDRDKTNPFEVMFFNALQAKDHDPIWVGEMIGLYLLSVEEKLTRRPRC